MKRVIEEEIERRKKYEGYRCYGAFVIRNHLTFRFLNRLIQDVSRLLSYIPLLSLANSFSQ